jgi:hypothetical protein
MFERNEKEDMELYGFCDSDWAGSMNDMKSTFGYTLLLGRMYFHGHQKSKKE